MKKILLGIALLLATQAVARTPSVPAFTFTPIDYVSLMFKGVSFFFSDATPKDIIVTASGEGKTQDAAVQSALVNAVQKGIGVLIVTDQTVNNGKVTRDLAAMYSSGVVNSYEIKGCKDNVCTVTANISPWQFRRKLEGDSNTTKVNGKDLHAQYITTQHALIQRQKLTEYYLSQIRQSGLEIQLREVKIIPTSTNVVSLYIDYEVRWNSEFKKSFITFLEKLEKDTNGRNEENHRVYIQWGPTGLFENRVYINTYEQNFRSMMMQGLQAPITVGVPEFGFCDRFDVPGDNILAIDWHGFRKQKTISISPNQLKNMDKISMLVGCRT
jgi:hypothetical protein